MSCPDRFSTDPEVGWRVWEVDQRTAELRSLMDGDSWPSKRRLDAKCTSPLRWMVGSDHDSPDLLCTCGIWAYDSPDPAGELFAKKVNCARLLKSRLGDYVYLRTYAVGRVSLWGNVLECEDGWRASRAYPYSLTLPQEDGDLARRVRGRYLVDVDVETVPWVHP